MRVTINTLEKQVLFENNNMSAKSKRLYVRHISEICVQQPTIVVEDLGLQIGEVIG